MYIPVYYVTAFLGGFLLFSIQPMVGKVLLPVYGGSQFVWIAVLFACIMCSVIGYETARFLTYKPESVHRNIHAIVCAIAMTGIALLNLPSALIIFSSLPIPPFAQVSLFLMSTIGLPVIGLSMTTTTLTRMSKPVAKTTHDVYRYANIGSFIGLFVYPLVLERMLPLQFQLAMWTIGLSIYLWMLIGIYSRRNPDTDTPHSEKTYRKNLFSFSVISTLILSAAIPVSLSFTVIRLLTSFLPGAPLLWLIPNGIYLLAYSAGFKHLRRLTRTGLLTFGSVSFSVYMFHIFHLISISVTVQILCILISVWCISVLLIQTLHAQVTQSAAYASFYSYIAYGGAIGAITSLITANVYVPVHLEFQLLFLTGMCLVFAEDSKKQKMTFRIIGVIGCVGIFSSLLVLHTQTVETENNNILFRHKSFYGDLSVVQSGNTLRSLYNGKIVHGDQTFTADGEFEPTSYYRRDSGVGIGIELLRQLNASRALSIGSIGLGVGTTAAYCLPGDAQTYYEINPAVTITAERYFTYLSYCRRIGGTIRIFHGDGRILLEQSGPETVLYDGLIIDAFTDDAIPVHLLTREAVHLYLSRIQSNGILLFHISNRYIDLAPVLQKAAYEIHGAVYDITTTQSRWILLSPRELPTLASYRITTDVPQEIWTDQYSSIFTVLQK